MANKETNNKKAHDVKVILVTILACAIVAGLTFYHFQSVQAAEKRGYINGASTTLHSIKSILSK